MAFRVVTAGEPPPADIIEIASSNGIDLVAVRSGEVKARLTRPDAHGYVMNSFGPDDGPRVTPELLQEAPGLRLVTYMGASRELADYAAYVDVDALRNFQIPFTSTTGADFAVAESTLALIHALELNLVHVHNTEKKPSTRSGLYGSTLGIVGMGQLGQRVAALAVPLGMRLIYHSRRRHLDVEKSYGAQPCRLAELFAKADHVTIHLPGSAPSGLINFEVLCAAQGINLINTSSAPRLVDPDELLGSLRNGNVRRAAIEGRYPSPYHEQLRALGDESVILLPPYTSWDTWHSRHIGWKMVVETYTAAAQGRPIPHRLL